MQLVKLRYTVTHSDKKGLKTAEKACKRRNAKSISHCHNGNIVFMNKWNLSGDQVALI